SGNQDSVAPRRQRQGRGVLQPIPQRRRHPSAAPAGKGRAQIRSKKPPGPGTMSVARLGRGQADVERRQFDLLGDRPPYQTMANSPNTPIRMSKTATVKAIGRMAL